MTLDPTSFVLQLINFAVLVWILHRFLYRPVLDAVDRRRAAIDRSMRDALDARSQAEALRADYEARFAQWEQERAQARADLAAELATLRSQGLAEAADAAARERERLDALERRRAADSMRETEERALAQAGSFVARLLERLGGPDLDARLVDALAADLARWPVERVDPIADAARAADGRVEVQSARRLPDRVCEQIVRALNERLGVHCEAEFTIDAALLSGVRVRIGAWILQANLHDELQFFTAGAVHAAAP